MVTNACDIIDAMNWDIAVKREEKAPLNDVERLLLDEISTDSKNIEDLSTNLNMDINDLMVNLTSMELKGLIKQAGGNYFISG